MNHLRAITKLCLLFLFTMAAYSAFYIRFLFLRITGKPVEPWRNRLMKFWSRGMCKILKMQVYVTGIAPEPPFFVVSNHLSYLDIVPLYGAFDCTFVAKKEVRSWPLIGFMAHTLGVIFVDRNRKRDVKRVNRQQKDSLKAYQGVVLFPEGTTSDGSDILPLRSPLLETAVQSGLPVHVVTIHYKTGTGDEPASDSVCWHGDISLGAHAFRLASTRSITCYLTICNVPVTGFDRKELTRNLENVMKEQYREMPD
jgi:lyso-ornithine lipid O-acyltransferase